MQHAPSLAISTVIMALSACVEPDTSTDLDDSHAAEQGPSIGSPWFGPLAPPVVYASPTGPNTACGTIKKPCSLFTALAIVSSQRGVVEMRPGIYLGALTIRNKHVLIHGAGATLLVPHAAQAGILAESSTVVIDGLTVKRGPVDETLPAIECHGGHLGLTDVEIEVPSVAVVIDCSATIAQSSFTGTRPRSGPALLELSNQFSQDRVTIARSQFAGASAIGMGIHGAATITNSVFAHTGDFAISTGGNAGPSHISFSTLVDSPVLASINTAGEPSLTVDDSILFADDGVDVTTGTGGVYRYDVMTQIVGTDHVIDADPDLVDVANGDFHLAAGSPAIDAADPDATLGVDFDGNPRPAGAARDIGAFESQ